MTEYSEDQDELRAAARQLRFSPTIVNFTASANAPLTYPDKPASAYARYARMHSHSDGRLSLTCHMVVCIPQQSVKQEATIHHWPCPNSERAACHHKKQPVELPGMLRTEGVPLPKQQWSWILLACLLQPLP